MLPQTLLAVVSTTLVTLPTSVSAHPAKDSHASNEEDIVIRAMVSTSTSNPTTTAIPILRRDEEEEEDPSNSLNLTLRFCPEPSLSGPCYRVWSVTPSGCYLIPDSNAMGDGGSSYQILNNEAEAETGKYSCILYTGLGCRKTYVAGNDFYGATQPCRENLCEIDEEWAGERVYRSFVCVEN